MSAYKILIMNNQISHLTKNFLDECSKRNILLLSLSAHTTHILQSLNRKSFQQYKLYYDKMMNMKTHLEADQFEKKKFLHTLTEIQRNTFTETTVCSEFKNTDIYSFKSALVINELKKQLLSKKFLEI